MSCDCIGFTDNSGGYKEDLLIASKLSVFERPDYKEFRSHLKDDRMGSLFVIPIRRCERSCGRMIYTVVTLDDVFRGNGYFEDHNCQIQRLTEGCYIVSSWAVMETNEQATTRNQGWSTARILIGQPDGRISQQSNMFFMTSHKYNAGSPLGNNLLKYGHYFFSESSFIYTFPWHTVRCIPDEVGSDTGIDSDCD